MGEQNRKYNTHSEKYGDNAILINTAFIESDEYKNRFTGITGSTAVDDIIATKSIEILKARSGTYNETLVLLNIETGDEVIRISENDEIKRIVYSPDDENIIKNAIAKGITLFAIHNHPTGWPPTADDCVSANQRGYTEGITIGHNGSVYSYYPSEINFTEEECDEIHAVIAEKTEYESNINTILDTWKSVLSEFGMIIKERR